MPGLYNGGRPGKRSGPQAGFFDGDGVTYHHHTTANTWDQISRVTLWVASNSKDAVDCANTLSMLGISVKEIEDVMQSLKS